MTSHDWQDVCDRCLAILAMPRDGSAPDHLCLFDELTLRALRREVGLTIDAARGLKEHVVYLGRSWRWVGDPRYYNDSEDPHESWRTGPFLPGSPPPIRFVSDLLLWTRQDILAVPNVGRRSLKRIEVWLARYGYTLPERDRAALRFARAFLYPLVTTAYRSYRSAYSGGRRLDPIPPVAIAAYASATIEVSFDRPTSLVGLYIAEYAGRHLSITEFRVHNHDMLANGSVPAALFDDLTLEAGLLLETAIPAHASIRMTFENISGASVRLSGALRLDDRLQSSANGPPWPPLPSPPPPPTQWPVALHDALNALTRNGSYGQDRSLFATLDPAVELVPTPPIIPPHDD